MELGYSRGSTSHLITADTVIYGSFAFSLIILNNITSRTKSTETDIRRSNERNGWQMAFMS